MNRTIPLLGSLLLTGCSAYVPMLNQMPLVAEAKQLEVSASLRPAVVLETAAAYSPREHIVLSGAGALGLLGPGSAQQRPYLRNRQGELGLGGYWLLGKGYTWLLNTTAGVGYASTKRRNCLWGCDENQGRYGKAFGQIGIAYLGLQQTISATYRLSNVQFRQGIYNGAPVDNFGSYRHEVGLSVRRLLGFDGQWFTQSTMGVSWSSLGSRGDEFAGSRSLQWHTAGLPALVLGIGIGWQPVLKRR